MFGSRPVIGLERVLCATANWPLFVLVASKSRGSKNQLGRYALLHSLGRGHLGTLWIARAEGGEAGGFPALVRQVTVPHGSSDPEQSVVESAWDSLEVQAPGVPKVAEVIFEQGRVALATDYVEAEPLASLVLLSGVKKAPFPVPVVVRIGIDLLSALELVHRTAGELSTEHCFGGVSPESILLGSSGQSYLTDVFVAAAVATLPDVRLHAGKIGYLAPEQLTAVPGPASDVFAIGVVLWELLSQRRYLIGSSAIIESKLRDHSLPKVKTAARSDREIPERLLEVLTVALDPNQNNRFQSAEEMSEALTTATTVAEPSELADLVQRLAGQTLKARRGRLGFSPEQRISSRLSSLRPSRAAPAPHDALSEVSLAPPRVPRVADEPESGVEPTLDAEPAIRPAVRTQTAPKLPPDPEASPTPGPFAERNSDMDASWLDDEPTEQLGVEKLTGALAAAFPSRSLATARNAPFSPEAFPGMPSPLTGFAPTLDPAPRPEENRDPGAELPGPRARQATLFGIGNPLLGGGSSDRASDSSSAPPAPRISSEPQRISGSEVERSLSALLRDSLADTPLTAIAPISDDYGSSVARLMEQEAETMAEGRQVVLSTAPESTPPHRPSAASSPGESSRPPLLALPDEHRATGRTGTTFASDPPRARAGFENNIWKWAALGTGVLCLGLVVSNLLLFARLPAGEAPTISKTRVEQETERPEAEPQPEPRPSEATTGAAPAAESEPVDPGPAAGGAAGEAGTGEAGASALGGAGAGGTPASLPKRKRSKTPKRYIPDDI